MTTPFLYRQSFPFRRYGYATRASSESRTGVTFAQGSGPGEIDITIAGSLSADTHFSTGAYLWWRVRDSLTGIEAGFDDGPRIVTPLIEFVSRPANSSNVEIGVALAPTADRTSNHNIFGGNFASAGRVVFGARHLSGTTADTVDTGGLGAFNMVFANNSIFAGGTDLILPTTYTVIGASGTDHTAGAAAWAIGASPWDTCQIACNIAEGDFVGLAVRAVGTTTATTATVRVHCLALRLDR